MKRFSSLRGGRHTSLAGLVALSAVALAALGSARVAHQATPASPAAPPTPAAQAALARPAGPAPAIAPTGGYVVPNDPVGAHAMLYLSTPYSFKRAMFAQAAAMHAAAIRVEVAPAAILPEGARSADFSGLDQFIALAARYHLPVVGVLLTIPPSLADCARPVARGGLDRCGTDELSVYGDIIGRIASYAGGAIRYWEIWNEPDTRTFFDGTPQQYGHMLRTAYDAIKQAEPADQVLLGGISSPRGMAWLAEALATPGADAIHAFDIANVHERGTLHSLAPAIAGWRSFFTRHGFKGPLWVTEHGYPSDSRYQFDPSYDHGAASQAAYLRASIPTLVRAGASEVFVTERDNLTRGFASEGVLGGDVLDPPVPDPLVTRKPAFDTVRSLAECYLARGRDCQAAAARG